MALTAMLRLFRDLRYAARQLRRTPGFTAITVLTLALGIAASTAVFAVVNAIVFRPAGLAKVDHVMLVHLVTRRVKGVRRVELYYASGRTASQRWRMPAKAMM